MAGQNNQDSGNRKAKPKRTLSQRAADWVAREAASLWPSSRAMSSASRGVSRALGGGGAKKTNRKAQSRSSGRR